MVVNYYGGCSPTTRMFQSRYPHHVYAAMGYVVLVVNPSGATGFGQKFSARHVDTAGEGLTDEIIEMFDIGYDKDREAITFPIRNIRGDCVFVATRSIKTKFFGLPHISQSFLSNSPIYTS